MLFTWFYKIFQSKFFKDQLQANTQVTFPNFLRTLSAGLYVDFARSGEIPCNEAILKVFLKVDLSYHKKDSIASVFLWILQIFQNSY